MSDSTDLDLTAADSSQESLADRRGFLSKSGMMLALLALAGGEGVAEATEKASNTMMVHPEMMRKAGLPAELKRSEVAHLNNVINSAISSGKIDTQSPAFLKLSPELRSTLGTLSASDLSTLSRARDILHDRFKALDGDNNGTIGM